MPLVSDPKTGTLIGTEVQIEVKASFGDCQDGPLPLNSITRFQKRVWGHSLNVAIPQFLPNRRQLPSENRNAGGRFPLLSTVPLCQQQRSERFFRRVGQRTNAGNRVPPGLLCEDVALSLRLSKSGRREAADRGTLEPSNLTGTPGI